MWSLFGLILSIVIVLYFWDPEITPDEFCSDCGTELKTQEILSHLHQEWVDIKICPKCHPDWR